MKFLSRAGVNMSFMFNTRFILLSAMLPLLFSCEEPIPPPEPEQTLFYSNKILNLKSVDFSADSTIYASGLKSINSSNKKVYVTHFDRHMDFDSYLLTDFGPIHKVYYLYPDLFAFAVTGSYPNLDPSIGVYFSRNNVKLVEADYNYYPEEVADYCNGYIPVDENSYIIHFTTHWGVSKTLLIENGELKTELNNVLEGFVFQEGISDGGKLYVLANKANNMQPSNSDDLYLFSSVDRGISWENVYSFGEIGYRDLNFRRVSNDFMYLRVGDRDFDFKSFDDGQSWQRTKYKKLIEDLVYFNEDDGYAVGGQIMFETIDGGKSWVEIDTFAYEFNKINFFDKSLGVVYSNNTIGYTSNAGESWKFILPSYD